MMKTRGGCRAFLFVTGLLGNRVTGQLELRKGPANPATQQLINQRFRHLRFRNRH
jgi:hypothetical protein